MHDYNIHTNSCGASESEHVTERTTTMYTHTAVETSAGKVQDYKVHTNT